MGNVRLLAACGLLVVAGCSAGSAGGVERARESTPPSAAPSAVRAHAAGRTPRDWPTYHGDNQRTGGSMSRPLVPPLHRAWARPLDGAVYAQPLMVAGRVIAATENNSVYALRRGSGHVIWRRHLGTPVPRSALPCGNIDPLGITGTPAYDAKTHSIFVVTETTGGRHTLRALNARTGHERWHRSLDVLPGRDRSAEQQRGALLVANRHVYVPFGGLYGDCGNYVGYLASVPTDGTGRTRHYAVPTDREAGMWAPPGPVQGKAGGDLFIASGNGAETGGSYDGSDSVIELTPKLKKVGLFAPSTWQEDNAQDLDLGSMSPVVTGFGWIVIAGKRGTVYLLDGLHGVGSQTATLSGCAAFGGAAGAGQVVFMPCADGLRRLSTDGRTMRWDWRLAGITGSPALARNGLYVPDAASGDLVLASARTGKIRARVHLGSLTRFATPVPVGQRVYVGTTSGVVAVRGS